MRVLIVAMLLALALPVSATEDSLRAALKEQIFEEAKAALTAANDVSAAVLTPETYRDAGASYTRAETAFDNGADVDRVRRILAEAIQLFTAAATTAPTVESFVAAAFQARKDAIEAGAEQRSPELWLEAEQTLYEATSRAELGRERGVERYAAEAESLFRDAELDAIEKVLFTQIDQEISTARELDADDWAPQSYERAQALLAEARTVLAADRYDTDQPRNLARQAMHNALHAQYVARLADDIDDNDTSLEAVLLAWEAALRPLGEQLDVPMYFDAGPDDALALVLAAIQERDRRLDVMGQELGTLRQRTRLLEEELLMTQSALEDRETAQARLDRRLAEQNAREQLLSRVERFFAPHEAEVLRAENRLIVRMVGLTFGFGSAELEDRHQNLLGKLRTALAEFPDTPVTIEGHTDSYGADANNMVLSVKRAEAVADHLRTTNTVAESNLTPVGFGETKPIANNETADGRQKNRRIDVVIYPTWWAD